MKSIIILPALSCTALELFNLNKTGFDKQYHWNDFKVILAKNLNIETSEMWTQCYILEKAINDSQIRDILGGNEKIAYKREPEALRVLASVMVDKYRDGKANIVYYLDKKNQLRYLVCRWNALNSKWYCGTEYITWRIGDRIFYPVPHSQNL